MKRLAIQFGTVLGFFLSLIILTPAGAKGGNMMFSESIESIRPAVVQIAVFAYKLDAQYMQQKGLKKPFLSMPIGSGFIVNKDGYVVTANHVIERAKEEFDKIETAHKAMYVHLPDNPEDSGIKVSGSFTGVGFKIVDTSQSYDLALLKLNKNPFKGEVPSMFSISGKKGPILVDAVSISDKKIKDGYAVAISGYPLGYPVLITNAGWIASSTHMRETSGFPPLLDDYILDSEINGGNSGGPVYLRDTGEVIGICRAVQQIKVQVKLPDGSSIPLSLKANLPDGSSINVPAMYKVGLGRAVPMKYLIEMLKKNNLTWNKSDGAP